MPNLQRKWILKLSFSLYTHEHPVLWVSFLFVFFRGSFRQFSQAPHSRPRTRDGSCGGGGKTKFNARTVPIRNPIKFVAVWCESTRSREVSGNSFSAQTHTHIHKCTSSVQSSPQTSLHLLLQGCVFPFRMMGRKSFTNTLLLFSSSSVPVGINFNIQWSTKKKLLSIEPYICSGIL